MIGEIQLLIYLAWHCVLFSFFAVGGGVSMLIPQMHSEFVVQNHFLDQRSFAELLAVSQAAPGPNFLLVPLLGFRIGAWPGLIVSLIAFLMFPVAIALVVGRLLHRHQNVWIGRFRRGFRPVTGGLWIASGLVIAATIDHSLVPILLTAAVAIISLWIDIPTLWWCLAAGLIGATFA
jgi:chromate transporter